MEPIEDKIETVKDILKTAALSNSFISIVDFYNLFEDCKHLYQNEEGEFQDNLWRADALKTLEVASSNLCNIEIAIYSSLINVKNGIPGSGFFSMPMLHQRSFYIELARNAGLQHQQLLERAHLSKAREIMKRERERVYRHAAATYR
ncbi:hypothetical protein [Azospirillum melinis]